MLELILLQSTGDHPALDIDIIWCWFSRQYFATGIDFRVAGIHKKRIVVTNGTGEGGGDFMVYRDRYQTKDYV